MTVRRNEHNRHLDLDEEMSYEIFGDKEDFHFHFHFLILIGKNEDI